MVACPGIDVALLRAHSEALADFPVLFVEAIDFTSASGAASKNQRHVEGGLLVVIIFFALRFAVLVLVVVSVGDGSHAGS